MGSWLEDQIFAIREAATENIKKLADKQENYLSRLTALFSINKLSTIKYKKIEDSYELINKHLLPILFKLEQDKVPNVRFDVAKSIEAIRPFLNNKDSQTLKSFDVTLKKMEEDNDADVVFFAKKALGQDVENIYLDDAYYKSAVSEKSVAAT